MKSRIRYFFLILLLSLPKLADAQEAAAAAPFAPADWTYHFQTTWFPMYHGTFRELYAGNPGAGSLQDWDELNSSTTATLFLGGRLWNNGALYFNLESSAGSGFSNVTGIAGFPNGEIYRVSDVGVKVIVNRLYFRQVFGLGGDQEEIQDDQNQLAESADVSRVTLVAGKFALKDFFDQNAYSADPRSQFSNWALCADGAWDYPADLQGYDWGLYLELNQKDWALRLSSVLENAVPNSSDMDLDIAKANGNTVEFEYRYQLSSHPGKARLLLFRDDADMGNYAQALALAAGTGELPNVDDTHHYRAKWGFELNGEQELGGGLGAFARLGWQDGNQETWTYTAIDETAQAGFLLSGNRWGRPGDQLGLGFAVNGLAASHQAYYEAGGVDFDLGDGQLNYAPEVDFEAFYNFHPIKEIGISPDFQYFWNPGYNQDRGPVAVYGLRCHLEL